MEINRKTKASLALLLTFSIALTLFASVLSDPGLGEFRWLGDTNLALCGQPEDNSQWDILISWGISSCINMRSGTPEDDVPYLLSQGLTYYHLPTTDWNISPDETHAGVQWINEQLADGRKVLIHCNHGTSRAPTMAAMWYIHEGHTAQEAVAWIQSYPPSYPSDMATQAMLDYYDWLHSEDPDLPENTDNLLFEPSVETVYHWPSGKTSDMIATLEHSSGSHTGNKGIKISSTYNQNGGQWESAYWFQKINNPVSGETYSFRTWYKSNVESTILFLAYHGTSNEKYVVTLNLPPSENWKQSSWLTATMPSDVDYFRVDCRLFNRNSGWVMFDDLELVSTIPNELEEPEPTPEPAPEPEEPSLLQGSFRFYKTSSMIAYGEQGDSYKISVTYNPSASQRESALWYQTIRDGGAGETYSFRVKYKSNMESTILFLIYDTSNSKYVVSLNLDASSDWKQSSWLTATMPSDVDYFRVDCRLFNRNSGWVMFDDLELVSTIPNDS